MSENIYLKLIVVFVPLSLVSFGGGQSIIAEIDQQVVEHYHWLTQAQFVDLFAISRAAPGPGALLTTLIGWNVAGIPGAVVASIALFAPSSMLAIFAFHFWNRFGSSHVRRALERSLTPIAAGLVCAGALSVLRSSSHSVSILAISMIATATLLLRPRSSPLLCLLVAGLAQYAYARWQ